jgi:hypothetical protein
MNDISIEPIKSTLFKKGLTEDKFCLRIQLKRNKIFYDGDLARSWKRFNKFEREELEKLTDYNKEFFEKSPMALDFSSKAIENSLNTITPQNLRMPSSHYNVDSKSLVIEIYRK